MKADSLAALSDIASCRQLLALREREAVNSALEDHTWRQIGEALGVSKQAVFQRFGKDWAAALKASLRRKDMHAEVRRRLGD